MLLLLLLAVSARAETELGAQLPDGARRVAEHRFEVSGGFEKVERFYRVVYSTSSYPRLELINQAGIKAVHIANPKGGGWEGINIYANADSVRIYVVPAEGRNVRTPKRK